MATWNTTITNKGLSLLTKQVAGSTLTFTKIVSGSGTVPIVNLKEQTAVSNIKQTLANEGIIVDGQQFTITVILSNTSVTTSYNLSQIGIYATDPDEGEILFAIAQIDEPRKIPTSDNSPRFSLEFAFTFNNSAGVDVEITPTFAGYATREELTNMIELGTDITE
jgi:hypothetical protein